MANAWRATDPESGQPGAVADQVCEILNDLDPYLVNVWRSLQADPEGTAQYADQPVNEATMHAIHRWLVIGEDAAEFRQKVRTDPDFFDVKRAGRWLFGACAWIGGGWSVDPEHGAVNGPVGGSGERSVYLGTGGADGDTPCPGRGVHAKGDGPSPQRPKLSSGDGVPSTPSPPSPLSQQMPVLGGRAPGDGLSEKRPHIGSSHEQNWQGTGVHGAVPDSHRPQLADAFARGRGVHGNDAAGTCASRRAWLVDWFSRLRDRLRTVRVCSGHWLRVCDSESVTTRLGTTGIFLDPPYPTHGVDGEESRSGGLYATDGGKDELDALRDEVLAYCLERGKDQRMRICVAGYDTDGYALLEQHGWEVVAWKTVGGYANRNKANKNKHRERLWFSPGCIPAAQKSLFDGLAPEPEGKDVATAEEFGPLFAGAPLIDVP